MDLVRYIDQRGFGAAWVTEGAIVVVGSPKGEKGQKPQDALL